LAECGGPRSSWASHGGEGLGAADIPGPCHVAAMNVSHQYTTYQHHGLSKTSPSVRTDLNVEPSNGMVNSARMHQPSRGKPGFFITPLRPHASLSITLLSGRTKLSFSNQTNKSRS